MGNILYLTHRLPYPPNKGDKLRSFHTLRHLAKSHNVYLGTFVDTPDDEANVPELLPYCTGINVLRLSPKLAALRSLNGLLSGDPLTVRYYRDARMQNWVDSLFATQKIDAALIFCSGMMQYVERRARLPIYLDLVDIDSFKWRVYANKLTWPKRWLFAREANLLLNYERSIITKSLRTFLVTDPEVQLLAKLAPECALRLQTLANGVDTAYFDPDVPSSSPFPANEIPIVFTGTMDYWINEEGALWFIEQVLPLLGQQFPQLRFYAVGRSPSERLLSYAGNTVVITGAVTDIRPYLRHARVVVAPIRTARGVQNKVLEAMSMGKPTVTDPACVAALSPHANDAVMAANSRDDYVSAISHCLTNTVFAQELGKKARHRACTAFNWESNLSVLDQYLPVPRIPNPA